jgi:RHS repeat-associated protein
VYYGDEEDCSNLQLRYWYHPDYLGSVEYVTDENGEAYQYFFRSPWGKKVEDQKACGVFSSAYKFNGKEQDEETGNYYYGARYYTAELGIWLSVDPLSSKYPNSSPYVFVANNPINLIDPNGMKWVNVHDDEVTKAQENYDSKKTWLGRVFAKMNLNYAKRNQERTEKVLEKFKETDPDLYNYGENLKITDVSGNELDVNLYVSATARTVGPGGNQTGSTEYIPSASLQNGIYEGTPVVVPFTPKTRDGVARVGFEIKLYGEESFQDLSLANEIGDVQYYFMHNEAAIREGGDSKFFAPGGGGWDAYANSGSGKYSFGVEREYRKKRFK